MKRLFSRYWIGLLLLVVACEVVTPPQGDFWLESDNVLNSLSPGGQVSVPIRIRRSGGFDGRVELELTGAPAGVTGQFDPASTRSNRSTLTVTAGETTIPGTYTLSVVGTSGELSRPLSLSVMVLGDGGYPNFNLAVVPASLTLQPGQNDVVDVVVNRSGGFSDAVTLSVSDVPSGVSASLASS